MSQDAFQVLSDCPDCKVDAAVVEFLDPTVVEGVAVESWCRLCGRREALGQLQYRGRRFESADTALAALTRWSVAEGEPDLELFCEANLGGLSSAEICGKLMTGERIHTSFDVVAFLFPGMAGGMASAAPPPPLPAGAVPVSAAERAAFAGPPGSGSGDAEVFSQETLVDAIEEAHAGAQDTWLPADELEEHRDDAVAAARALAAVMLADGVIRPGEERFLSAFLAKAGLPPAEKDDLRAWRPQDVPRPADPEPLVQAMIDLAHIDRERDGTEWRVVREFARYWGFPMVELERRGRLAERSTAPAMKRLWRSLRGLVLTEKT